MASNVWRHTAPNRLRNCCRKSSTLPYRPEINLYASYHAIRDEWTIDVHFKSARNNQQSASAMQLNRCRHLVPLYPYHATNYGVPSHTAAMWLIRILATRRIIKQSMWTIILKGSDYVQAHLHPVACRRKLRAITAGGVTANYSTVI